MDSNNSLPPEQLIRAFFKNGDPTTMPNAIEVATWLPWTSNEKYEHPSYGYMKDTMLAWTKGRYNGCRHGLKMEFVCHKCGFMSEWFDHQDFGDDSDKMSITEIEHHSNNSSVWVMEMEKHVNNCWQTHWRNPEWDKK